MAAAVVVSAVGFVWAAVFSDGIPFLVPKDPARWIVYPNAGRTAPFFAVETSAVFGRSFSLGSRPGEARLRIRAFRRCTVTLNGREIDLADDGPGWKKERRIDVAEYLVPGANEIAVEVFNDTGPPALWAALELPGETIATDALWEASWLGAAVRPAREAGPPPPAVTHDPDRVAERVFPSLLAGWRGLAGFAVAACVIVAVGFLAPLGRRGPAVVLIAGIVLWAALFVHNAGLLRRAIGFDSTGHFHYVKYVQENLALPLADAGWQAYQPPLFYAVGAAVLSGGGWTTDEEAGAAALRLVNLAAGIVNLIFVAGCLRMLFPDRPYEQALGISFAAFLPASIYLFHYPTNEGFAIAWSSAAVFVCLRLIRSPSPPYRDYAILGLCLGGALLAKFSTLLLVPVALGVVIYRRSARGGALAAAVALAVCGWHYARVWARFGVPVVGNWDAAIGVRWWQDPGYRTPGDYLRFGQSLVEPWFAGFYGVWDGFYSTLWGDALLGGRSVIPHRPQWSYDVMAWSYLLALVPTVAILIGVGLVLYRFVRAPRPSESVVLAFAFLAIAGMIAMTLRVPSYAQAKSFYGLIAIVPLTAFAVTGLGVLAGRERWRRLVVTALFCTWAVAAYATYWVDGDAADTRRARAEEVWDAGDNDSAERMLRAVIEEQPDNWNARLALAGVLGENGTLKNEMESLLRFGRDEPLLPRRHRTIASLHLWQGNTAEGLAHARRAIELNPDEVDSRLVLARLLWKDGQEEAAIEAFREALRVNPGDENIHASFGTALARSGRLEEGIKHCHIAVGLDPDSARFRTALAVLLMQAGRTAEAIPHLETALRIDPDHADARRVLERAREKTP